MPLICISQELQSSKIDSFKLLVNNVHTPDTVKANALIDIAFMFRNISVDSAKFYAVKSLEYSKKIGYKKGEAQALRNIGLSYLRSGNYETAINLVKKAVVIAKINGIQVSLADCYNTLGTSYFRLLKYDSATYYYLASAELFKELNQSADVAGAYLNIGSIYKNQGNTIEALRNFQESLLVFEELNHQQGIAAATYNLSGIFSEQGDYIKAIYYLKRTAKIDSASNNLLGFAESLGQLGGFYAQLNKVDSAIYFYQKSITNIQEIGSICHVINPASNLGELYLNKGTYDSAYYYLQYATTTAENCKSQKELVTANINLSKYYTQIGEIQLAIIKLKAAYDIASKNQLPNYLATASNLLYKNYKSLNQEKQAIKYLEEYDSLQRALFNAEETRKIAQLEAEYMLEKERQKYAYEQEMREFTYQKNLAAEQKQNIYFILITAICLIIMLVLWRLYHQKSKYNSLLSRQSDLLKNKAQQLEQQGEEIKATNEHLIQVNKEKNTIIGIVAHDLKNPLHQIQGITNIIKLEKYSEKSVQEHLKMIEEAAKRSVNFIDRILDISAAENKEILIQKSIVNLNSLLSSIQETFKSTALAKNIRLVVYDQTTVELESDLVILRETIENLVSNAIKFGPKNSEVGIYLEKDHNNYLIKVTDEGPGIDLEDQKKMFDQYRKLSSKPTNNEKSTGLGLAIVRRNINALGYSISTHNRSEKGTEFIINIPIPKP